MLNLQNLVVDVPNTPDASVTSDESYKRYNACLIIIHCEEQYILYI